MGDPALRVRDASFSYARSHPVLRGVSFHALAAEVTMILGASGSGKTTLLKLVKGLLPPRTGEVSVLGARVSAPRRGRLDPRVAYIPQQLGLVRSLSALDNTVVGALSRIGTLPSLMRIPPEPELRHARELLGRLGIAHKADEPVQELSGGERQRVAIARALMQRPRVILADEFISDLDPLTSAEIMSLMREATAEGAAVVMTTHEMDVVREHADHVVVLRGGAVSLDVRGAPEAALIAQALRA
ncbi:MAG: ATP-binding cassette domain-containing protein [Chloroflexi bacterium]|nr:ATP-binding cassette domain-containing protein [Chloroflexota bacterium]